MITLVLQKKTQLHFFEVNVFGLVTAVPDTLGDGKGVSRVKRHLRNTSKPWNIYQQFLESLTVQFMGSGDLM